MTVSSYLEAFLTVYGWDMYYIFYLLLGALGFYLYPVARVLIDIYQNFISGSEYAGTNYMRQFVVSMVSIMLVFLVAIVPFKSLTLARTIVKSSCTERNDVGVYNDNGRGGNYFENTSTRAPIMPWIAMAIGQGVNSVIYKQKTCALDVTETRKATMSVNLEKAANPELLKGELDRFVAECHTPAVNLINSIRDGAYEKPAADWMKQQVINKVAATGKSEKVLLGFYDSDLIKDLLYNPASPMASVEGLQSIPGSLVAKKAVPGFNGYEAGSTRQGVTGSPPSCYDWWVTGGSTALPLRNRIAAALSDSAVEQISNLMGVSECRPDTYLDPMVSGGLGKRWTMSASRRATCRAKIITEIYSGNADQYVETLLRNHQGSKISDNVISESDSTKLGWGVAVGSVAAIISKITGVDLGADAVAGQLAGFYITLYLLKLLLQYLIPFILMTIYMFWGVYMVIGEFKGMAMIRGMILITALCVMPGLWSIIGHLDDQLYGAMYGGSNDHSLFNRLLLDIATSIFEIAIVFVVFFLINQAGGGNAAGAVNDTQTMGMKGSQGTGSSIGSSSSKTGFGGLFGGRSGKTGKWTPGLLSRIGSGFKGGLNRMRGK